MIMFDRYGRPDGRKFLGWRVRHSKRANIDGYFTTDKGMTLATATCIVLLILILAHVMFTNQRQNLVFDGHLSFWMDLQNGRASDLAGF